jgi:hypothetical protein
MSYTWRSVLRGLDLMKKGMVWRVGDGRGLKIWSDPWLPRSHTRKPITPRGTNLITYVDELISPVTGTWDKELVHDMFWEEDYKLILALPVLEGQDNSMAWHYDKHGKFSVKSAYRVCRDYSLRQRRSGASQGASGQRICPCWKQIWEIKCPNKIKHFLWRFTHNSHPLRCNLARRGMKLDVKCPVYGREGEDGGHLFFKCKLAR